MNTTYPTSPFETDFYQFTMSYAYIMSGKASETTGFESFFRHKKEDVSGKNNFVIFQGEKEVKIYMQQVKKAFETEFFFATFWDYISSKLRMHNSTETVDRFYEIAKAEFKKVGSNFEYTIIPNGTKLYPKVPAFQFKGPKLIGQMIETPITNIINGQTGFETFKYFFPEEIDTIENIDLILNKYKPPKFYRDALKEKAKEYRNATTKILLEAGFRRSGNFAIAKIASMIAIECGWNGTSNTAIFGKVPMKMISGTMAHAFVMAFDKEINAFIAWDKIFPKSTMLIDTYDTIKAIHKLIDNNIKPAAVRIDSDPLEKLAFEVRKIMDEAGWKDVKIFLSGDITPEKLIKWEKDKVPFDMCMAGTKYVNIGDLKHINVGFVYKVVEYDTYEQTDWIQYEEGKKQNYITIKHYPVKKATGKSNYPGLKTTKVVDGNIYMTVEKDSFGFSNVENISNKAKVNFKELA